MNTFTIDQNLLNDMLLYIQHSKSSTLSAGEIVGLVDRLRNLKPTGQLVPAVTPEVLTSPVETPLQQ